MTPIEELKALEALRKLYEAREAGLIKARSHEERGHATWTEEYLEKRRLEATVAGISLAHLGILITKAERVAELEEALRSFARIADMEERAEPFASVMVNINLCRRARALLTPTPSKDPT